MYLLQKEETKRFLKPIERDDPLGDAVCMSADSSIGNSRPTCIIGDRHPVVVESLALLLEHEGFSVVGTSATGEGALELIRSERPTVAVLDMDLEGITALQVAREADSATAIVIVTGRASASLVHEAFSAGVRAVALKSVPPLALLEALAHAAAGKTYVDPVLDDRWE